MKSVQLTNGLTLPYAEQGDESGPPIVFLHGFAGSWRSFERVLSHLPHAFHAFALTQRGHGEASKPEDGYRLHNFAADVAAFMDAQQIETAVIAGHSMGGAIAQRFALDYPERTRGLVLMATTAIRPGGPQAQAFWDEAVSKLSDPIRPAFVREFLESVFARPISPAFFERLLQDSLMVPAHVWQATWKNRLELQDATDELKRIAAPTLILWGDQDTRTSYTDQEQLVRGIANARLVVYDGAGHAPHIVEPERCVADIAAFIDAIAD